MRLRINWIDFYWRSERSVGPKETICRFLRHRSDYRTHPQLVAKERAFLPHKSRVDAPLATSTFMIGRLRSRDIWRLGRHRLMGVSLHGRADLVTEQVTAIGLRLDADSRFRRHVDIVGWADQKARQKLQAQKLARACKVNLAPPRSVPAGEVTSNSTAGAP